MIAVLRHFQIKSVKEILKGKFFHSGTFPRNICEFLRRELLNFFICSCFIIHSTSKRTSARSKWESCVYHCFSSSFTILFLLCSTQLQFPSFTLKFIIWFLHCLGYFICKMYLWQLSLEVSLILCMCVLRQDVDAATWGEMGEEFARRQPSGKNTALGITQGGRRQMPGLWPVKSR